MGSNAQPAAGAEWRRLPYAVLATAAVVGAPVAAVSALAASGAITGLIPLIAAGVALSLAASYGGAAAWSRRRRGGDVLFTDLMLWGWLRRRWAERQIASAAKLLGGRGAASALDAGTRVRLLKQLASALEARYPDTHGHSRRVARHAAAIARRMGLGTEEVRRIRTAAAIHDVGKLEIPDGIIEKPAALSDAEFAQVKRHAEIGARMVAGLGDEELTRIVRHHHERIDGGGYPDGLASERIPLGARIVAVADTFDAVTSTRPYRAAKSHREALELLAAEAGTQLDAGAVAAFRRHYGGQRPLAALALLLHGPRQLLPSLLAQVKAGGAVTAATLAAVASGSVAPPPGSSEPAPRQATATAGAATDATTAARRGKARSSRPGGRAGRRGGRRDGDGAPAAAVPRRDAGAEPSDVPAGGAGTTGGGAPAGGRGGSAGSGSGSGGNGREEPSDDPARRLVPPAAEPVDSALDTVVDTAESALSEPPVSTDDATAVLPETGAVEPRLE